MPVQVHGVLRADDGAGLDPADLSAAAGTPVRDVAGHGLAALVTDVVDDEVLPSRANLLAHTRLLEHVAGQATVLPMRFGVVVPDDQVVVDEHLAPRADELQASLQRLAQRVEVRVTARYVEDEIIARVLSDDRRLASLRGRDDTDAQIRLGEGIAARIDERRARDAPRIVDQLTPHAVDVSHGVAVGALDVVSASFLVDRSHDDDFQGAVDALRATLDSPIMLEVVGPLPPFSFTGA